MTPIARRNVANILIVVGLLPILLWLLLLAYDVLHPGELLPWVSAGIIMFGVPFGIISLLIAVPVMLFARNRAAEDSAVWTPIHRIPFFFGVATFLVAAIMGILIVTINIRW
jgi:hypothetical protein